ADGLKSLRFQALTEDRSGHLCAIAMANVGRTMHHFDGRRFTAAALDLPPGFDYAWGDAQINFQDQEGDWWIPTGHGVMRFAQPAQFTDLAHARPKAIYSVPEGLPHDHVLRLFE